MKDVLAKVVPSAKEKLDTIFIMGDIVGGYGQGFTLPEAGGGGKWIRGEHRAV